MIGKYFEIQRNKLQLLTDLSVGDILVYHSHSSVSGYSYYEIKSIRPGRLDNLILQEICRDKIIREGSSSMEDQFQYGFDDAIRTFVQVLKASTKVAKQLLCRVAVAKVFIEDELNEMLLELEI